MQDQTPEVRVRVGQEANNFLQCPIQHNGMVSGLIQDLLQWNRPCALLRDGVSKTQDHVRTVQREGLRCGICGNNYQDFKFTSPRAPAKRWLFRFPFVKSPQFVKQPISPKIFARICAKQLLAQTRATVKKTARVNQCPVVRKKYLRNPGVVSPAVEHLIRTCL